MGEAKSVSTIFLFVRRRANSGGGSDLSCGEKGLGWGGRGLNRLFLTLGRYRSGGVRVFVIPVGDAHDQ